MKNEKNYLKTSLTILFTLLVMLWQNTETNAQVVNFNGSLQPADVSVCDGSSPFVIDMSVLNATSNFISVNMDLADGIEYAGALSIVSSTPVGVFTITEADVSDLAKPKFSIQRTDGNPISVGNVIKFTFDRKAICDAYANALASYVFKDKITVDIDGAVKTEDSEDYNVVYPNLVLTPPAAENNKNLLDDIQRTYTVENGGITAAKKLFITLDYGDIRYFQAPGAMTLEVNAGGGFVALTPTSTNGTEVTYTLEGANLDVNDNELNNGESVTLRESFKLKTCGLSTSYTASWGCDITDPCQVVLGQSLVTMAPGAPNFAGTTYTLSNYTNMCTPYTITLHYKNTGTGGSEGAMCDVNLLYTRYESTVSSFYKVSYSDFKINGNSVTNSYTGSGELIDVKLKDVLNADPDGEGVGLDDVDGDGFYDDLPAGATVSIVFTVTLDSNVPSCNSNLSNYYNHSHIKYHLACDTEEKILTYRQSSSNLLPVLRRHDFTDVSYVPANILSATLFSGRIEANKYSFASSYGGANSRYVVEITVPTGLTIDLSSIQWVKGNWPNSNTPLAPGSATQTGNVITVVSPDASFGHIIYNATYACQADNSNVELSYKMHHIADYINYPDCISLGENLMCGSKKLNIIDCDTGCPGGGPATLIPIAERDDNSLGWTDATMTTLQSRSAISAYDLSKVMYKDEFNIKTTATQNGVASNLGARLKIRRHADGTNSLTPLVAEVSIMRAGAEVASGTSSIFTSASSSGDNQVIDWDLTSILPAGGLQDGDQISITTHYQVITNKLVYHDVNYGRNWYIYNSDSGAGTPVWEGIHRYCRELVPEIYLVGTSTVNGTNAWKISSCNATNLGGNLAYVARRFDSSGIKYQNEYRPSMKLEKFYVEVPKSLDIQKVWYYRGDPSTPLGELFLANSTDMGTYYLNEYDIPSAIGHFNTTVKNNYGAYVRVQVKPTCATSDTPSAYDKIKNYFDYTDYYYYAVKQTSVPSELQIHQGLTKARSVQYSQKPEIDLISQVSEVDLSGKTGAWVLRYNNPSASTAPYNWLALPDMAGLTINSVTRVSDSAVIPPIAYADGQMYQLSDTGIASGGHEDYTIAFTYEGCIPLNLEAQGGWNCSSYPASPNEYICNVEKAILNATPKRTTIEMVVVETPPTTPKPNLCTPLQYVYQMQSSDAANLYEPVFKITATTGLEIEGSQVELEYPTGSGNWETFPVTVSAGVYEVDALQHSNLTTLGYLPGLTEAGGVNANRQVNIRFQINTDCDFVSGGKLKVKAYGKNLCNVTAEGSGSVTSVPSIDIDGAQEPYTMSTDVQWGGAAPGGADCKAIRTVNIKETIVAAAAYTTPNTGIIEITIPAGFKYVNGSYVGTTNAPALSSLVTSTLATGDELLTLEIPAGLQTADDIEYTFDIQEDENNVPGCGNYSLEVVSKEKTAALSCGATTCSSTYVVTGNEILEFDLQKSNLFLSMVSAHSVYNATNTEDITVVYQIANTSNVALATGTEIMLFDDKDDNDIFSAGDVLVATQTTTADITTTASFTGTFTANGVNPADLCHLKVSISPMNGCFCSIVPAEVEIETSPELAGEDIEVCEGGTEQIGLASSGYTSYVWSSSNASGVAYLSATNVAQPNFTYTGPALTTDLNIDYEVTVTRPGGCTFNDVVTVTVKPKPVVDDLSAESVVYCNDAIGSAILFSGAVSGATYSWVSSFDVGFGTSGDGNIGTYTATNSTSAIISTTVTVTPHANGCTGDSKSFTITVYPIPVVMDTISPVTYCNEESASAITFTGPVLGTTYSWTSSEDIGFGTIGNGNIGTYTASNTTNSTVTATVTVIPHANGCTGTLINFTITVKPTPVVNDLSSETAIYCNQETGSAITFTGTVTGTTYSWTSDANVGFGTSGNGNIAAYTATNTTNAPIIATVTVTPYANGGCTGEVKSFTITVNPTPVVNDLSSETTTYCNGETGSAITFTGTVTGITYSWTSSIDVGFGLSGNGNIGTYTATNMTTAIVTATVTVTPHANGCTGESKSFTITVNPTPVVNDLSSETTTYCNRETGSAISFTGPVVGTTYSWTSSINVGFGTSGNGNIEAYTATNITTDIVTATVTVTPHANGCTGDAKSFTITVNPTPVVDDLSSAIATYCNQDIGSAVIFTGPVEGTTYSWTSSEDVGFGTAGNGNIGTYTATNMTTAIVTAIVTITPHANGCTGDAKSFTITVNPTPTVDPLSSLSYCSNVDAPAIHFSGSVASTKFLWSTDYNIGFGLSGEGDIPAFTTSNTTNSMIVVKVVVTPVANGCVGNATNFVIGVEPTLSPADVTPMVYCNGEEVSSIEIEGKVNDITYQWVSSEDVGFGVSGEGNISAFTAKNLTDSPLTTVVEVTASNRNGCVGVTKSFTVTVNPTPVVTGEESLFVGHTTTLEGTLSPASSDAWTVVPGGIVSLTGTTGTEVTVLGTSLGTVTVTYTTDSGCSVTHIIEVANSEIIANDDDFGTFDGEGTSTSTITVFEDDTLNGNPVSLSDVTFTPVPFSPTVTGGIILNSDGTVTVKEDTPAGIYTTTYTICEKLNPTNCDEAVVTIKVRRDEPSLELIKSSSAPTAIVAGSLIEYTFVVANTGNVDLKDVTVSDTQVSDVTPASISNLAVGAKATFTGSYAITDADIIAGKVTNTATAAGISPDGTVVSDVSDSGNPADEQGTDEDVTVTPLDKQPKLELIKSSSAPTAIVVGSLIEYTFVVANTGNVELKDVTVSDTQVSDVTPASIPSLAVGAKATFTGSYALTEADIIAGEVTNTAEVTGTMVDGTVVSDVSDSGNPADEQGTDEDVTVTPLDKQPKLELIKSSLAPTSIVAGSLIEYTFEVTNTGNVDLKDVKVSDVQVMNVSPASIASLSIGETATFTGSYAITDADIVSGQVTNTAEVTGTMVDGTVVSDVSDSGNPADEQGTDEDVTVTPLDQHPELTLIKSSVAPTSIVAGSLIEYTFEVTNTGNVDLVDVKVSDTQVSDVTPVSIPSLAVGETATFTGSYALTDADIVSGQVTNTAEATGTMVDGTVVSDVSDSGNPADEQGTDEDVTVTPLDKQPKLELIKSSVAPTLVVVGSKVEYTFEVTNTGNVDLSDVIISDVKVSDIAPVSVASLSIGETVTFTGSYALTEADIIAGEVTNTAEVTGAMVDGTVVSDVSDSGNPADEQGTDEDVTVTPLDKQPKLELIKSSVAPTSIVAGSLIEYTFEVTNTGNVDLKDVKVSDVKVSDVTPASIPSLAVGETVIFTGSYAITDADIVSGQVTNTAEATGTMVDGTVVSDVSDSGNPADEQGTDEDVTVTPLEEHPALELIKTSLAPTSVVVGSKIEYTFVVANTGNVDLSDVMVKDAKVSDITPASVPSLAVGDKVTFTGSYAITQPDINAGKVVNTATAEGISPAGTKVSDVSDSGNPADDTGADDDATVTPLPEQPSLELIKTSVAPTEVVVGSKIDYTFVVANTGNVDLSNVMVKDAKVSDITPASVPSLAVGDKVTFTGSYAITQPDINAGKVVNTATAEGTSPAGKLVSDVSDSGNPADDTGADDDETVTPLPEQPSLELIKTSVAPTSVVVGSKIDYTFVVENTGNVDLKDVMVKDTKVSDIAPASVASLAVGDKVTFKGSYTITQSDIDAGKVVNTATAEGTSPAGTKVSDVSDDGNPADTNGDGDGGNDETVTEIPQTPSLELIKTGVYDASTDKITYTFKVTNDGNVTVNNITVTDAKLGVSNLAVTPSSLLPGEEGQATYDYAVTQSDIDAGKVVNTATTEGASPAGKLVSDVSDDGNPADTNGDGNGGNDETVTEIPQTPSLELIKTGVYNNFTNKIVYTFKVINEGNVTLSNITIKDSRIGVEGLSITGNLLPGKSAVETHEYSVTQADIDAKVVTNTAIATGTAPNGDTVSDVSDDGNPADTNGDGDGGNDETVTAIEVLADLSVVKEVNGTEFFVGDEIEFTLIVENEGPNTATKVQVKDLLPSGYEFISSNGVGSYDANSGIWTIGDLLEGEVAELVMKVKIKSAGDYVNVAEVESEVTDPDLTNNRSEVTISPEFHSLTIPEIFSPNGDGTQDKFKIQGLEAYPNAIIRIYNRWGNLVYKLERYGQSEDRWWDGRSNQRWLLTKEILSSGTYFYVLDLNDGSGKSEQGYFFLNKEASGR